MPELPEVETVVRGLRSVLPGRRIVSVRLGKTDFVDDPAALAEQLPGKRIEQVERLGKFIRLELASEGPHARPAGEERLPVPVHLVVHLLVHLGMTGNLTVRHPQEPAPPHTHAFFELDDGRELRYTDIRRFGRMLLVPDSGIGAFRERLGAEPLGISAAAFDQRIGARRARIKAVLLDQRVLGGIGNIYADESLWLARIHPARLASRLGAAALARLRRAIRNVLRSAIRLRGSSISDFVDADGNRGAYQQRHRAYGREGQPCFRCGAAIRRATVAGRSSHFCPRCQPAPRPRPAARRKRPESRGRGRV